MAEELKLRTLSRLQAQRRFEAMLEGGFSPQEDLKPGVQAFRDKIRAVHEAVANSAPIEQDRAVGIALYEQLPPQRLMLRTAADDGVWRFLSLDVLPDAVRKRKPDAGEDWFWKSRWRIWLKRIWWLIHLSWQGDAASTASALRKWTTDSVAQFVERPGQGFRVDLWRAIASETGRRTIDEAHFRRAMKLNTALLTTYEPTVSPTLMHAYVADLFKSTAKEK